MSRAQRTESGAIITIPVLLESKERRFFTTASIVAIDDDRTVTLRDGGQRVLRYRRLARHVRLWLANRPAAATVAQ